MYATLGFASYTIVFGAPSSRNSVLTDVLPLIDHVVRPELENGVRSYRGLVGTTPGASVASRIGVLVTIGSSARALVSTTAPRSAFSASSRGVLAVTVTVSA